MVGNCCFFCLSLLRVLCKVVGAVTVLVLSAVVDPVVCGAGNVWCGINGWQMSYLWHRLLMYVKAYGTAVVERCVGNKRLWHTVQIFAEHIVLYDMGYW